MIVFLDDKGRPRAEFGNEGNRLDNGRATDYAPFIALLGSDGKVRLRQGLDTRQYPFLSMGDHQTEARLLLGHSLHGSVSGIPDDPWDNWSLLFRDPSHGWMDYVDIGVTTPLNSRQRTGYLVLRNSASSQLLLEPKK